jgi:hypothetical protein
MIVLTFIFYIFLKLIMYHMIIIGYKRGVIMMDMIVRAFLFIFKIYKGIFVLLRNT